jgi:hypothetical protein
MAVDDFVEVLIAEGKALNVSKVYKIATCGFMVAG